MLAPPVAVEASFWRGGTSRGLLFRASHLAPFSPAVRDRIILTALGSPDPSGRQVGGLGGGVSSLSKACIVSFPGEAEADQRTNGSLPGVSWADEGSKDGVGEWDVVYRFAQVGIRKPELDWTATCGNMLSAVALGSVAEPIVPYTKLWQRAKRLQERQGDDRGPFMLPINILSASNGVLMKAKVPVDPDTMQVCYPKQGEGVAIAGVAGTEVGIELESPIASEGSSFLPTGSPRDTLTIDGRSIPVSIVSAGLPNVYVSLSSLGFDDNLATLPSAKLQANTELCERLETVRRTASEQFSIPLSAASPKVILVARLPDEGYTTSAGDRVGPDDADLLIRAVSTGDFHATIPGTTLGAVNIAVGLRGTLLYDLVNGSAKDGEKVTVRAAHAAGVAESTVRFTTNGGQRRPESVVMMRTAREIMRGSVMISSDVLS